MTENPEPQPPAGGWPVTEPVDLDAMNRALDEQQAEREHGENYVRERGDLAWEELVLDNIRIDLERQSGAAHKCSRAHWWIAGVISQLDAVLRGNE